MVFRSLPKVPSQVPNACGMLRICTHMHMHVYINIILCIYTYIYICKYICAFVFASVCVCMPCFCWSGVGFAFSCFFRSLGLLCKCLFRSLDCFYIQSLRAFRRAELFDFSFVVPEFLRYLQEGLRFQQQSLVRTRYNYKLILVEVQGVVQGGRVECRGRGVVLGGGAGHTVCGGGGGRG